MTFHDQSAVTSSGPGPTSGCPPASVAEPDKPSLVGMTRAELAAACRASACAEREISMRVAQLWHWIYFQGATSFDAMLNISKVLRGTLAEHFTLARPQVAAEQISADGTRKWLIRFDPVDARATAAPKSNASIFPRATAARSAFRARSAAR